MYHHERLYANVCNAGVQYIVYVNRQSTVTTGVRTLNVHNLQKFVNLYITTVSRVRGHTQQSSIHQRSYTWSTTCFENRIVKSREA